MAMKMFSPKTVDHWRQWLAEHHASEEAIRLLTAGKELGLK